MIGTLKDLTINRDQTQNITITVDSDFREMFDKLKNVNVEVEIKKVSQGRSMEANAYFWSLCGKIAKASSKYSTDGKNEVYREAIKAKGESEQLLVREEAVNEFIRRWSQKGTGWFAELVDDYFGPPPEYNDFMGDNVPVYKVVEAYYGSSTYNTASMSRIIDYVVNIANDLGIETMTENERQKMIDLWAERVEKK